MNRSCGVTRQGYDPCNQTAGSTATALGTLNKNTMATPIQPAYRPQARANSPFLFKIIDFGRAIYKYNGKTFCSDSFQTGGDAATQYNTEPYFNEKKPRLEPNFSFDLCRLACSIFDYIVDAVLASLHISSFVY